MEQLAKRILNNKNAFYRLCKIKKCFGYINMGENYFFANLNKVMVKIHCQPGVISLQMYKLKRSSKSIEVKECIYTLNQITN